MDARVGDASLSFKKIFYFSVENRMWLFQWLDKHFKRLFLSVSVNNEGYLPPGLPLIR